MSTRCYDQYGAVLKPAISWNVSGGGSIDANGLFTAGNVNGNYTVTARSGNVSATFTIRVGDAPQLSLIEVTPVLQRYDIGQSYRLFAKGFDQYGDSIAISPAWSVTGGGGISSEGIFTPTVPGGPFALKVNAGNLSRSYTFYTSYPLCNIALGKPVIASSEVQPTNLASKINDGDESTRWESFATDNEWITIDLQNVFEIEKMVIKWEAAFTKIYDIQILTDNINFTNLYAQTNGFGGTEVIPVSGTGRYVRLFAKKRGTGWANSIYEWEIYGTPQRTGTSVLTTLVVEPSFAIVKDTAKQKFVAKGYDQFGNPMPVNPQWSVIGRGNISSDGTYTPTTGSMYLEPSFTVVAKANGLVNKATVVVEEVRRLMQIDILPFTSPTNRLVIPQGFEYVFAFNGKDQFGVDYRSDVTWTSTGGGNFVAPGIFKALQTGDYMIFAGKEGVIDTAFISIRPLSNVNLAWHKPVQTSSDNGEGSKGDKAVDGLTDTRWESVQGVDPQWISIDLQAQYNLTRVVLFWEATSAKAYRIETSNDNQTWTTVYSTTTGAGGREEISISAQARYVRIFGTQRNTGYGYSLWEVEVYGQSIVPSLTRITVTPNNAIVAKNQNITFSAKGYNQLGEEMSISPVWSCNQGTMNNSGTYASNIYGEYKVYARVGNIWGTAKVKINRPPSVTIEYPQNNTQFAPGTAITAIAYAYDEDGTISRVEFKEGDTLLGTAYRLPYTVQLTGLTNGTHTISAIAYDNVGTSSSAHFTIVVGSAVNLLPLVNAGEDRTITLPVNSVSLSATASDPDGSIVAYQWEQLSGPSTASLNGVNAATLVASNLNAGTYTFKITVTDNNGATASDEVQVTVLANAGNIALNKPVTVSSTQAGLSANWVNDGKTDTRWGSNWSDPQWVIIDLQGTYNISQVILRWETASAKNYTIDVSNDGNNWTTVKTVTNAPGGVETHNFSSVTARYIRMYGTSRNTGWGYSLWEFEVYGNLNSSLARVITNIAAETSRVALFPNPASNKVSIQLTSGKWNQMYLLDMMGRIIKSAALAPDEKLYEVNVDQLKNGKYLIILKGNNGEKARLPFIKQ
ncbi:MAG: discoidin domain-containing protein [Bacteroidales bacterium]